MGENRKRIRKTLSTYSGLSKTSMSMKSSFRLDSSMRSVTRLMPGILEWVSDYCGEWNVCDSHTNRLCVHEA